jgi:sialate O-acetylesterase
MKLLSTLPLISLLPGVLYADVRLPGVLTSHMVVQADTDVKIWGWADPGERVSVTPTWLPKGAAATANDQGKWEVSIKTPKAGQGADGKAIDPFTPHTITIKGKNTIVLDDVLIGEVWLCSGQSNMEWNVRGAKNWEAEAKGATVGGIRLFDVENAISERPQDDCRSRPLGGQKGWTEATPTTVPDFSAVGYFFGRELRAMLNVPIGLVASDWGGTPAQSWTSEAGLKDLPAYRDGVQWMHLKREGRIGDTLGAWWKSVDDADRRAAGATHWASPTLDDASWGMARVPGSFSGDLESFDGIVWMRRTIDVPAAWAGKALTLAFGPIDDMDATYFDGREVGATFGSGKWFHPRSYSIPGELVTPGTHTLAVRVLDVSGPGGMTGKPEDAWVRPADGSGTSLPLEGYWKVKAGAKLADVPPLTGGTGDVEAGMPTALSNGMIEPITTLAIRGAIWYQGESNRDRPVEYSQLMHAMITDWRSRWGRGDFPFYLVQIAPFTYGGDKGETAELRESQRRVLTTTPNTGMVVTMDIGDPKDIHPTNKQDVGHRLALWALAKTYAQTGFEYSGPLAKGVTPRADALVVSFDHAGGLSTQGGAVTNLEVAGADGTFVPAVGIIEGSALVVRADAVKSPVSVRYGWCDACAPNLMNGVGLPASPFVLSVQR